MSRNFPPLLPQSPPIDVIRNVLRRYVIRSDMRFQSYAITGNACIGASEARAILTESETDYRERRNFRRGRHA